jgi:hypothetical protein
VHCKSKKSIVDARAQGWRVVDDRERARWRRSSNEGVGRAEGAARVARQQAGWLQGGGAMLVVRGGGVVSRSSLLYVGLQLSSRVDVGGGHDIPSTQRRHSAKHGRSLL